MKIVCLDLEGVLLPEFWEEFSKATKIEKLMLTTRDVPDYDALMKMRLEILDKNNLGMKEVLEVVEEMEPLEGAKEFLDWLRERTQVVILTGTYYEYIMPLMKKLGYPFMCANSLEIKDGKIVGYKPCGRQKGEKRAYPACRPTPAKCKAPGKGKKWGKKSK